MSTPEKFARLTDRQDPTASRALVTDANQRVTASAVTATELGYLSGVTSSVQTQLDADFTHSALASGTSVAVDFDSSDYRTLTLSHDPTFTTTNRPASSATAKAVAVKIDPNGANRTPTFPAWTWLPAAPTLFNTGKKGVLSLTALGTAETDVIAVYVEEA